MALGRAPTASVRSLGAGTSYSTTEFLLMANDLLMAKTETGINQQSLGNTLKDAHALTLSTLHTPFHVDASRGFPSVSFAEATPSCEVIVYDDLSVRICIFAPERTSHAVLSFFVCSTSAWRKRESNVKPAKMFSKKNS